MIETETRYAYCCYWKYACSIDGLTRYSKSFKSEKKANKWFEDKGLKLEKLFKRKLELLEFKKLELN